MNQLAPPTELDNLNKAHYARVQGLAESYQCIWFLIALGVQLAQVLLLTNTLIMLGKCQAPEQSANSIASYISQPINNLLLLLKFTILNLLVYNMHTITVPWQNTRTALMGLLPKLHGGTYLLQPCRQIS